MAQRKRYLVTGGFGFIGSHLVERLLDLDCAVHVVDNLSTSPIDYKVFINRSKSSRFLTYDICTVLQYCRRVKKARTVRFDGIFHLAAVVGPVGVLAHAGRISRMMVEDMQAIAELATRTGAKIVDVSTSEVYGGGRDGLCTENDTKFIQPEVTVRLEYAVGKLAAEISLVNLTKVSDLRASIVRPFNVAGPRQSPKGGFVLPRFILQALKDDPITVYHDGTMVRAFTHVDDMAEGIRLAMELGENGRAYNVGNPANKIMIGDLAKRVIHVTKSRSKLSYVDPRTLFGPLFAEANDKYPDANLAMKSLGWTPRHDMDAVISSAAEYIASGRTA